MTIVAQTRPQDRLPDIAYVFAPLKHARLDYMVQKAVEMGAARLQPVLTRFTQVSRVNGERMRANVIEAAEQCGILSLAEVADPMPLDRFVSQRQPARLLVFCDEAAEIASPIQALHGLTAADGIDILIGPEGGFAEEERVLLLRQPKTLRLCLGPPNPAGGYRRRRGAGAGAGRTRRLGQAALVKPAQAVKAPSFIKALDEILRQSLSKPRPGHAKACANKPLNLPKPAFRGNWTSK